MLLVQVSNTLFTFLVILFSVTLGTIPIFWPLLRNVILDQVLARGLRRVHPPSLVTTLTRTASRL